MSASCRQGTNVRPHVDVRFQRTSVRPKVLRFSGRRPVGGVEDMSAMSAMSAMYASLSDEPGVGWTGVWLIVVGIKR